MRAPARSGRPTWPRANHINSFCFSLLVLRLGAITGLPHSQVLRLDAESCVKHIRTKQHWHFGFVIQDDSYCQSGFAMQRISEWQGCRR